MIRITLMTQDLIKEYYDKTGYMYRWFYSDSDSLGIHYGFWDTDTKTSNEALKNVYTEVQKYINPKKGQVILDAGCGVGGASLWLAKNTEAEYVGITISPEQLKQAEIHAKERNLGHKTSFFLMNYHKTDFPDKKFDGIFFIESSCYADLDKVAQEMMRLLKPDGKLVIIDFSHPRPPQNNFEKKMVDWFCLGFKLPRWQLRKDYEKALFEKGFKNVIFFDKTAAIKKTVNQIYLKTLILAPFFGFLRLLRLISRVEFENGFATYAQKKLYDIGLFQ